MLLQFIKYLFLLVEVCKHRKASFASEFGTPDNDRLTGCDGNIQVPWVCLTHLEKQREYRDTHHKLYTQSHTETQKDVAALLACVH